MFHEESFLNHLRVERRLSKHTLTAYQSDLEQFVAFCQQVKCLTSVTEVRHLHIRGWIMQQMDSGQSSRSVNRRLSCLKTYFHYLKKQRLLTSDPMKKVVAPKMSKQLPAAIAEKDLTALFTLVDFPNTYEGRLHRLILEILYATGLRRGELVQLQVHDVDTGRAVLRVQGKGGKQRLVPFARYLSDLLDAYLAERLSADSTQLLIDAKAKPVNAAKVYHVVKKYLSLVTNAEKRSPHVLRHSFATHLSDRGADLNAIKELLGHANLSATEIYMHNSVEKLKKVYEQAHPKGGGEEEE